MMPYIEKTGRRPLRRAARTCMRPGSSHSAYCSTEPCTAYTQQYSCAPHTITLRVVLEEAVRHPYVSSKGKKLVETDGTRAISWLHFFNVHRWYSTSFQLRTTHFAPCCASNVPLCGVSAHRPSLSYLLNNPEQLTERTGRPTCSLQSAQRYKPCPCCNVLVFPTDQSTLQPKLLTFGNDKTPTTSTLLSVSVLTSRSYVRSACKSIWIWCHSRRAHLRRESKEDFQLQLHESTLITDESPLSCSLGIGEACKTRELWRRDSWLRIFSVMFNKRWSTSQ